MCKGLSHFYLQYHNCWTYLANSKLMIWQAFKRNNKTKPIIFTRPIDVFLIEYLLHPKMDHKNIFLKDLCCTCPSRPNNKHYNELAYMFLSAGAEILLSAFVFWGNKMTPIHFDTHQTKKPIIIRKILVYFLQQSFLLYTLGDKI